MILKTIKLENFRNYESLKLNLDDNLNILIGDNGEGKTNLLESIYFLSFTKSHRLFIDNNLISSGKKELNVWGEIESSYLNSLLSINLKNNKKNLKVDDESVKGLKNYLSKLKIIIFYPEDLELVKGSPGIRRKFLNLELSQMNLTYLKIFNEYSKILKMRNDYLKKMNYQKNKDQSYLDVINEYLIDKATDIYIYRNQFIRKINENITGIYKDLTELDNLSIKYETNIIFKNFDKKEIKEKLFEKFKKTLKTDLKFGSTMIGPHKDNFKFILNNNDLKLFGSQGQQRLAVIALKLSEILVIKEVTKDNPILLLDDVFSELDNTKKNNLIKYISNDIQTIITTTDINSIDKTIIKKASIFTIKNGDVLIKEEV